MKIKSEITLILPLEILRTIRDALGKISDGEVPGVYPIYQDINNFIQGYDNEQSR